MMKKFIIMIMSLLMGIVVFAQTHTVERGENLQSIAAKYNVTVAQLVDANPGADKLFYVGLKLNIPEITETNTTEQQNNTIWTQSLTTEVLAEEYEDQKNEGLTANDFSHVYINYTADPKFFDKGFYGIGFCAYNDKGFGASFSAHGNWGIVDKGQLMFKFGPVYGFAINQYLMVNAALRGFIYTYDKANGINKTSTDQKVDGGITLTPGVTVKLDRFFIDAGFDFGWAHGDSKLYKTIQLGIGYKF